MTRDPNPPHGNTAKGDARVRHPPSRLSGEPRPLCGGIVSSLKCKQVCQRCGALVANCNGD